MDAGSGQPCGRQRADRSTRRGAPSGCFALNDGDATFRVIQDVAGRLVKRLVRNGGFINRRKSYWNLPAYIVMFFRTASSRIAETPLFETLPGRKEDVDVVAGGRTLPMVVINRKSIHAGIRRTHGQKIKGRCAR